MVAVAVVAVVAVVAAVAVMAAVVVVAPLAVAPVAPAENSLGNPLGILRNYLEILWGSIRISHDFIW